MFRGILFEINMLMIEQQGMLYAIGFVRVDFTIVRRMENVDNGGIT